MKMQKTVLITGCSSGIGLACAQELQKRDYNVFATVRQAADVKKLTRLGLNSIQLDITDSNSIKDALKTITQQTNNRLDILINNCSYAQAGAIEDLTKKVIQAQFETNLFGPLELTTHVLKIMRQQNHGRIIQIGSLLGYVSMPYRGAYCASKFALEGLSDTLRQELHNTNIHVAIIEPGPIHSKIRANAKKRFLENLDLKNSIHHKTYQKMHDEFFSIDAKKSFYLQPEAVIKKIIQAITCKKPKARYYVGFPAHFFSLLKHILPTFLLDRIILEILKRE
jgi:short-subunit dehydrogenase